jgi:hypothetical protein
VAELLRLERVRGSIVERRVETVDLVVGEPALERGGRRCMAVPLAQPDQLLLERLQESGCFGIALAAGLTGEGLKNVEPGAGLRECE